MIRDFSDATKYARNLPTLRETLKTRRFGIKNLGSRASVRIELDLNPSAIKSQVFRIVLSDRGVQLDAYLSRQELEHYLRTI